jgi:L-aminopeptidase/D-esterase-like protein
MAWLWWLLAPALTTGVGATVMGLSGGLIRPSARRTSDESIAAHRAVLAALSHGHGQDPCPVTVLVSEDRTSAGNF